MSNLPTTVYKYRAVNSETLGSLFNDAVFFANPGTFNDPLDCNPTLQCDSTHAELRNLLTLFIRRRVCDEMETSLKKAKLDGEKVGKYAQRRSLEEAQRKLDDIDFESTIPDVFGDDPVSWLLTQRIERELKRHYVKGVCCFSKSYFDPLLWSHYGDQHNGICIGYSLDRNPKPNLKQVVYGKIVL